MMKTITEEMIRIQFSRMEKATILEKNTITASELLELATFRL
jgi:hypothetical protein